jgi:calcineurin-like phosphoesterase family protein
MKVFFISDLHIGHKNILTFAQGHRYGDTMDEHDRWLVEQWNSVVKNKKDIVYVLGDVCFDRDKLKLIGQMNGNKILLLGNHDQFKLEDYQKYFYKIIWFSKYKGYWISHAPIHPNDRRYINVCVEMLNGVPIEFDKIKEKYK